MITITTTRTGPAGETIREIKRVPTFAERHAEIMQPREARKHIKASAAAVKGHETRRLSCRSNAN